ncbi:MAG TPA: hypothetical protein GX702_15995 [Chloroflexi bacterium]|nr:hypothetical protein [Chloroflexota bacterium]
MHSIRRCAGMLFLIIIALSMTACEPFWSDIRALRSGHPDDLLPGTVPILGGGRVIVEEAYVESIELTILDGHPIRVTMTAHGRLPDRCTEISRVSQAMSGNTIMLSIYTTRPVDAICLERPAPFIERLLLNLTGLEPGLYTVSVNGVTAPLHLSGEMVYPQPYNDDVVSICPGPGPGMQLFRSDEDGYCLLVPDYVRVRRPAPGVTTFTGPIRGNRIDPVRAALTIQQLGTVIERPIDDVAREYLNEYIIGGAGLQWVSIQLGGEDAVVVDGIPGHGIVRQAFVVHRGVLYVLSLAPIDPAQGRPAEDAEAIWQAVISSFTFMLP